MLSGFKRNRTDCPICPAGCVSVEITVLTTPSLNPYIPPTQRLQAVTKTRKTGQTPPSHTQDPHAGLCLFWVRSCLWWWSYKRGVQKRARGTWCFQRVKEALLNFPALKGLLSSLLTTANERVKCWNSGICPGLRSVSHNEYSVQTVFDITVLSHTPGLTRVDNLLTEKHSSSSKARGMLSKIPHLVHHVNMKSNLLHVEELFREADWIIMHS